MQFTRCLAAVLALLGPAALSAAVQAQTPTAPPATPVTPPTATPVMPPTAQPALDLMPLRKALKPLAGGGSLESRSNFQMTGSKQGISFTFREEAKITAKRPGRFRAELTQMAA
ncbi:MAG: hypothetical protein M3Y13_12095, partial [Armatimonadota bacterium]|nr:hypothetical protein [Armatimonadota bacterium]